MVLKTNEGFTRWVTEISPYFVSVMNLWLKHFMMLDSIMLVSPTLLTVFLTNPIDSLREHVKNNIIGGIFLKRLRSKDMPRNTNEKATYGQLSPLDAQRGVRGYLAIFNNIQLCPKQHKLVRSLACA